MGVLETRIRAAHTQIIEQQFGQSWRFEHNEESADNMHIVVLWKDYDVEVQIVCTIDQMIHCWV